MDSEGHEMQWELDSTPQSAAVARELVRREVRSFGKDVEDTAVLLTDELVANAVLHGQGPVKLGVSISVDGQRVTVSVSDADSAPIAMDPEPDGTQTRGRGLFLVDSLASRWGTEHHGTGKRVWFELEQPCHSTR